MHAPLAILLAAAEEHAHGYQLIDFQWETFVWALVIFGVLVAVLAKFAWKPLLAAVEGREKRIADSLKKAEEIQRAAADIAARQEAALAEAHAKAKGVLDEARAQAEDYRKRETDRARQEADAFLDRAKKEIGIEETRVREALRREVVEIALEAASKVLGRVVNSEDDRRLAAGLVDEVEAKRMGAGRN